jgi:23S rRNA pseudouridine2605 synthase
LIDGVYLAEGRAKATGAKYLKRVKDTSWIELVLQEGRNREIRRLLAKIGHKVLTLRRVSIGTLRLGELPVGAHRELTAIELRALKKTSATSKTKGRSAAKKSIANRKKPRDLADVKEAAKKPTRSTKSAAKTASRAARKKKPTGRASARGGKAAKPVGKGPGGRGRGRATAAPKLRKQNKKKRRR